MNNLPAFAIRMVILLLIPFISYKSYSQSNYAAGLDGVNDYVSTSAYVVPTSGNFTVELWAYATNYTGYQEFVSQGSSGTAFYIGINSGSGVIRCGDTWLNSTVTMPLNRWVHIALVKSGGSATLYLDGMQRASLGSGYSISPAGSNFQMGTQYGGFGEYFNGSLDEIRVWNVARTPADIKANMVNKNLSNATAGLIAYYRFNEGSGTLAANSCTNTPGINGVLTNGTVWTNSPIQFAGNAISLDGVDDHVVSTATFNLNMSNSSFTVEALINSANVAANTTTDRILLQWGNTWQAGAYQLVCTNNYIHFNFNGSSTGSCTYNVNWQDGNWHHVAGVFDISTHTLYLYYDGVQRAAVSTGSNAPGSLNGSLYIGGSPSVANSYASTKIDEVRVWNVARSQSEIQAYMYKEINHPFTNIGTVPRLYYNFNQGIASGTNTGLVTVTEQYLQAHGNGTLVNFALSGTSNYVVQNNNLIILPLQWQFFTAEKRDKQVLLKWSTVQEQGSLNFFVQHSTDGNSWNTVATIPATGNSSSSRYYSYSQTNPAPGMNFYRILQNDQNGKYSYSDVRTVRNQDTNKSFEVISNPVMNKVLQLQVNASSRQIVQLFGSDGKLIWTKQFSSGMHKVGLAMIQSGTYILKSGGSSQQLLVD